MLDVGGFGVLWRRHWRGRIVVGKGYVGSGGEEKEETTKTNRGRAAVARIGW